MSRDVTRLEIDYQSISIADYNPENKKGVRDLAKWHLKESQRKVKKLLSDEGERKHRIQEIVQWKESVIKKQANELGLTGEPETWNVRENMKDSHTIRQKISEKISECFKQVNYLQKNHQSNRREKSKAAALTKFYTSRLKQEQLIKNQLQKQVEEIRNRMLKKHRATEDLLVNNSHTLAKDLVKQFVRRMRDIDEGIPDDLVDWEKHGTATSVESERNLDNLLATKDEVQKQKKIIKDLNLKIKKLEMKEKQRQMAIARRNKSKILDDFFVLERLSTLQEDKEMGLDEEDEYLFGGKTPGDKFLTPFRKQMKKKKVTLAKSISRDFSGMSGSSSFDGIFVEDQIGGIRDEVEDKTIVDLHREAGRSNFLVRARRRGYKAVERIVQIGNFNEEDDASEISKNIWEVLKRESEEEEQRRELDLRNLSSENQRLARHVKFLEKLVRRSEKSGGGGSNNDQRTKNQRSRVDKTGGSRDTSSSPKSSRSRSRSSGPDYKKVVDKTKKELKVKSDEIKKLNKDNDMLKKKVDMLTREVEKWKKKFEITKEKHRQLLYSSKEAIRKIQTWETTGKRKREKEREETLKLEMEKTRIKREAKEMKREKLELRKKNRKLQNEKAKLEQGLRIAQVKKMQDAQKSLIVQERQRKVKKSKEELSKAKKMIEGEKRRVEKEKLRLKRELDVKKMIARIQHKYKMEELEKKEKIIGKIERKMSKDGQPKKGRTSNKTTPRSGGKLSPKPSRDGLNEMMEELKEGVDEDSSKSKEKKEITRVEDSGELEKEEEEEEDDRTEESEKEEDGEEKSDDIKVDEKIGEGEEEDTNILDLEDMEKILKRINELEMEQKQLDGASEEINQLEEENQGEEEKIKEDVEKGKKIEEDIRRISESLTDVNIEEEGEDSEEELSGEEEIDDDDDEIKKVDEKEGEKEEIEKEDEVKTKPIKKKKIEKNDEVQDSEEKKQQQQITETTEEEEEGESEFASHDEKEETEEEEEGEGEEEVTEEDGEETEEEDEEEKIKNKKKKGKRVATTDILLPFGDVEAPRRRKKKHRPKKKKIKKKKRIKRRKKRKMISLEEDDDNIWGGNTSPSNLNSVMNVSTKRPPSQKLPFRPLKIRKPMTESIAIQTEENFEDYETDNQQPSRVITIPKTNENTVVITYDNRPLQPTVKSFSRSHKIRRFGGGTGLTISGEEQKHLKSLQNSVLSAEREKMEEQLRRDRKRLVSSLERERHLVFQEREILRRKAVKHDREIQKRVKVEMNKYRNRLEDSECQTEPVNFSQLMVEKVVDMIDRTLRNPKDEFTQHFLKMHFKRFKRLGLVGKNRPGTSGGVIRNRHGGFYDNAPGVRQFEEQKKRKQRMRERKLGGPEVVSLPLVRDRPGTTGGVLGGRRKRSMEWNEILDKYDRVTSPPKTSPETVSSITIRRKKKKREPLSSSVDDYVRVKKDRYINDVVFAHPTWKPGIKRNSKVKQYQSPYTIGKGKAVSANRSVAPRSHQRRRV